MNFNITKLNNELKMCRFCLKEEGLEDITTYFLDSSEKRTYAEVLQITFNVQLSHFPTVSRSMMCEACVKRLREASNFKQMVVQSDETLTRYLQNVDCGDGIDHMPLNEDLEVMKLEATDVLRDCDITYDNELLNEDVKFDLTTSYRSISRKQRKCKIESKSETESCKLNKKHKIASKIPPEKDWSKIAERRGTGPLLRENSLKLIQNSTLCVFQWNKSRYRCFCCDLPFTHIDLLKQHTYKEHTIQNIEKKIILQQNRLVKVEISNLECKLCHDKLDSITLLLQHLSRNHSMDITEHLLVPFRLEDELKCQICFEKFDVFRLLNIHVNRHFQKQVCHICGAGFSNLVFLNLHRTRSHRAIDCKSCDLTFNSRTDKKTHERNMHGVKHERRLRFPCPFCPERFFQENFKVKHLVEKHSMPKPEHKCSVCTKSFLTRSLCNNHIKNVHKKEKNQECDVCHNFFYTKSDVARHKVTHTGEKKYSCGMCNSVFASRDSLRRHMKRTHVA